MCYVPRGLTWHASLSVVAEGHFACIHGGVVQQLVFRLLMLMNCLLKGVRTLWPFMGGLRLSLPSKAEAPPFFNFFRVILLRFCQKICLLAWLKPSYTGFSCVSWFMLIRWTITVIHTGWWKSNFVRWSVYYLPILSNYFEQLKALPW